MKTTSEVIRIKDAFAWVHEGECIHLKASTSKGQPAVLSVKDARDLAERLLKLAQTLENLQARAASSEPDDRDG